MVASIRGRRRRRDASSSVVVDSAITQRAIDSIPRIQFLFQICFLLFFLPAGGRPSLPGRVSTGVDRMSTSFVFQNDAECVCVCVCGRERERERETVVFVVPLAHVKVANNGNSVADRTIAARCTASTSNNDDDDDKKVERIRRRELLFRRAAAPRRPGPRWTALR